MSCYIPSIVSSIATQITYEFAARCRSGELCEVDEGGREIASTVLLMFNGGHFLVTAGVAFSRSFHGIFHFLQRNIYEHGAGPIVFSIGASTFLLGATWPSGSFLSSFTMPKIEWLYDIGLMNDLPSQVIVTGLSIVATVREYFPRAFGD
ncbi:MAG: hypothetical protein MRY21_02020 [Simkaniaceae bacterium]|nr:hypothetical protein [Simkaniaceae bacterium]